MRLLLISNSTLHGQGYLDHCEHAIKSFLGNGIQKVLFIPYARPSGISHDEYSAKAKSRFKQFGFDLSSIHEYADPISAVNLAQSVFIGGGNSFVLLDSLQKNGIIPAIRERVLSGMPYIGTSAGSNVACPTIMTTNDMPIAQPDSFRALDLFPYQINPHYIDSDPNSQHMGETRETRILEFMVFNSTPVIGLREGAMILVDEGKLMLLGTSASRIFKRGEVPYEISTGNEIKL